MYLWFNCKSCPLSNVRTTYTLIHIKYKIDIKIKFTMFVLFALRQYVNSYAHIMCTSSNNRYDIVCSGDVHRTIDASQ